jgi:hypothetical protein
VQVPDWHVSFSVQELLSLQGEPFGFMASEGHVALAPVQVSGVSHCWAAGRHTVDDDRNVLAGHVAEVPVQFSAASHTPALARQTVVGGRKASVGQLAEVPVQFSATSQAPALARQDVLDDLKPSGGQLAEVPEQVSATSQAPADARHTVPDARSPFGGHVALVPVQVSATSHAPADARQTEPAFPAGCWQVTLVPSHWSFVQTFPSSVQTAALAFFASVGQAADEPVQFSAMSHSPTDARQTVADARNPSVGQVNAVPLHVSATSQAPAEARQTVPAVRGVQVPRCPARLHAPQVPLLQVLLQQTPFAQKPDAHWLFELHANPNDASYKKAELETALVEDRPPATRTMFPDRSTARWPCSAPGIDGVAVQVVVLLNSSADDSVSVPVDDPPATSTCPLATMLFGRSAMLWPTRGEVIVPADDHVPLLTLGSKTKAVARTVDPFFPPVTRILPFELARERAVCCSRGPEMDASVLKAFCTGSLPPTSSTWLFSWLFDVWINVAVWFFNPTGGIGPVVAAQDPFPDAGL